MESILHQLYYGNISPSEQYITRLEEYRRLRDIHLRQYDAFFQSLEPYQQKEFNKIMDQQFDTIPMEYADVYANGFQTGAKMMLEVFRKELSPNT